jgi:hypothetical protein
MSRKIPSAGLRTGAAPEAAVAAGSILDANARGRGTRRKPRSESRTAQRKAQAASGADPRRGTTRTPDTEESYRMRDRAQRRRAARELGVPMGALEPEDYVSHLLSRLVGLRPSSVRQCRAAATFAMREAAERSPAPVAARLEACVARLAGWRPGDRIRPPPRTSALKIKRLDAAEWDRLLRSLARLAHVGAPALAEGAAACLDFLPAAYATGLRPSEWANARLSRLDGGSLVLLVGNAKATNGRAHGPRRTLVFADDPHGALATIEPWLSRVRRLVDPTEGRALGAEARREALARLYKAMRRALRAAWRSLHPRRRHAPTLYTARHMAAARLKSLMAPEEVAALMGHAVDETCLSNYARPPRGGRGLPPAPLPRPLPQEVARVRRVRRGPPSPGAGPGPKP